MRRRQVFVRNFSQKLEEIVAPFYDKDEAYSINPIFRFVSVFFEGENLRHSKIGELPEIVKKAVYSTFGTNTSKYGERMVKDPNPYDVEFYARQFLTMDTYKPVLINLINEHLTLEERPLYDPSAPFLQTEHEILSGLLLDYFGLRKGGGKSFRELAEERGWSDTSSEYWINFALKDLRQNQYFVEKLLSFFQDIEETKLSTFEQRTEWEKSRYFFDMEKALDRLNKNPRSHGDGLFQHMKKKLLRALHSYGLTGPQIAEELGVQRQTVYRHVNETENHFANRNGVDVALRDYQESSNPGLKGIIERRVFQPRIECIAAQVHSSISNNPFFQLLSDSIPRIRRIKVEDISPLVHDIFYQNLEEPIETTEEKIKEALFDGEAMMASTAGLLETHLPPREFTVLKYRYGLSGETRTLSALGDMFGRSTTRIFQYKNQGLKKIRTNPKLKRAFLKLWKKTRQRISA